MNVKQPQTVFKQPINNCKLWKTNQKTTQTIWNNLISFWRQRQHKTTKTAKHNPEQQQHKPKHSWNKRNDQKTSLNNLKQQNPLKTC